MDAHDRISGVQVEPVPTNRTRDTVWHMPLSWLPARCLAKLAGDCLKCSDGCGLEVAFACAVGRSEKLLQSFKGFKGFKPFKGFKGFKGLRAGKRQAWTPIRSH